MSSGYSSVTADPSYKLLQSSLPYCVFRNKQRYHLLPPSSDKTDGGQAYHQHETAEAQTKLLLTSAAGQFVPSYLTYGTIRLEMQNLPPVGSSPLHNTVISLQYDQLNLFVHPGGRYLDELVLRDVHHTFRGEDLDRPPGFTLPLSKGSQLREVAFAGTTHWGTKSQLLARAGSEIYHVRTLGLDEYRSIPATESEAEQGHRHMYETSPVILEPTQKWQLPTEISSMACSTTGWSTAGVLGANGAYFTWTPTDGIKSFHGGKSVLPHTEEKGYMKDFTRRTECSWHPQVHYLTSQESLYTLDLRSQSMAVALYSAAGPVLSPKQHDRQASLLLVSVKDAVQLVDVRYPKGCVAQQYVPHGHQLMASVQTPYTNSTAGAFLGAHREASQLYLHTLESSQQPVYAMDFRSTRRHASGGTRPSAVSVLSASHPAGAQSNVNWDVDGLPLVDSGDATAETASSASIMGFALSPVFAPPTQDDGEESDREERRDDEGADSARSKTDHNALLVQQNSKGDVFVQRVEWGRNPFCFAPTSHTSGVQSLAASRQASKKRRRVTGSQFEDSDEEDSSSDGASQDGGRSRRESGGRGNDGSATGKSAGKDAPAPAPVPPVQMCLPCGIRCSAAASITTAAGTGSAGNTTSTTAAWREIKKYLKTTLRNNGLILSNVLSSQSDPADVNRASVYPAGAAAFPPFVSEDSLRGFDLLRMDPSDIHATDSSSPRASKSSGSSHGDRFGGGGDLIMVDEPDRVHQYLAKFRPACMKFLQKEAKSLWEIWKYALQQNKGVAVDLVQMREILRSEYKLVESLAPVDFPLGPQHSAVGVASGAAKAPGKLKKTRRGSLSSSDASQSDGTDSDVDPSNPAGQDREGQQHPPRATFDGLYVVDAACDAQLGYFRDQSKGYEVRLSRLQRSGGIGDTSQAAKLSGKTSSAAGASALCGCVHSGRRPLTAADVPLCGEDGCLSPHFLLYRIDHSTPEDAPRAATKAPKARPGMVPGAAAKTSTAVSGEPYYWGGATRATVPGATQETSGLQSPAARGARSQFSTVKTPAAAPAMSQQSLSLSQLMFGSQHVPPTSQKQSQGASQSQAFAEEEDLGLDVTDNMMAVLNNNWNRAVGSTSFVDTALSSLLQARR